MSKLLNIALALAVLILSALLFFQPARTRIDEKYVRSEIVRVAKAVSAEETLDFHAPFESTHWGSSKKVLILAKARVFAGFDLNKHLIVTLDSRRKRVSIELGPPEIIGVDVFDQHYYDEQGGVWNPITTEDRDVIARGVRQMALNAALSGKLLATARESMKDFLTVMWRGYGFEVNVEFRERKG